MDASITQILTSSESQDRKKAIKRLAQTGGPEALRALAGIYKRDPDPNVRELAIQAGKYIKKQEQAAEQAAAPVSYGYGYASDSADEDVEDEDEPVGKGKHKPEEIERVPISASQEKLAKGLLDRALDMSMRGEHDLAVSGIVKAFKTNPNFRLDSYALGIALSITGMEQKEFLELLSDKKQLHSITQEARQQTRAEKEKAGIEVDPEWDTVIIDLVLYFVVVTGLVIIGLLIAVQINKSGLGLLAKGCATCSAEDQAYIRQMIEAGKSWQTFNPLVGFIISLAAATGVILYILFYFLVLHVMARLMLGQNGSYRGILRKGSRTVMLTYGLGTAAVVFVLLMSMRESLNPRYLQIYGRGGLLESSPIWKILLIGGFFLTITGGLWLSFTVAKYYDVRWGQARNAMFWTYNITSTSLSYVITEVTTRVATVAPALPHK